VAWGFHSIGVPSEWGHDLPTRYRYPLYQVSIQLVSPASGDLARKASMDLAALPEVSIQLVSPASGDGGQKPEPSLEASAVSIQLVSPASGDLNLLRNYNFHL